jgi:hypothetical protein
MSRLVSSRKVAARKDDKRTLVDVASLKVYYESLPLETDSAPLVFVHPVTGRRHRARMNSWNAPGERPLSPESDGQPSQDRMS